MIIDANMYYIPEELFEDEGLLERFLKDIPEKGGMQEWKKYREQKG